MESLFEYLMFLAKAITIVVMVLVPIIVIALISARARVHQKEHLEVNCLNERYKQMADAINAAQLPRKEFKELQKKRKKEEKQSGKKSSKEDDAKRKVFVFEFKGDPQAHEIDLLREGITAALALVSNPDEIVVKVESPGGQVHAYGLAASQLARIKDRGIPLTVAVDKVAASGGYLMASVADKIIAAPFAVVGSIGVIAQIPNIHRKLKKHDIDFHQFTAGEYKRTVGIFAEPTEKGKSKLLEEVQDVHELFKEFVGTYRPQLDLDTVSTGEAWHGTRALDLNLVDEIRTSDDYLLEQSRESDVYEIKYVIKKKLSEKFSKSVSQALQSLLYGVRDIPGTFNRFQ